MHLDLSHQSDYVNKLEVVCTSRQQKGAVKFGLEHDIRPGKGKLSAEQVRAEAAHYQDNADK